MTVKPSLLIPPQPELRQVCICASMTYFIDRRLNSLVAFVNAIGIGKGSPKPPPGSTAGTTTTTGKSGAADKAQNQKKAGAEGGKKEKYVLLSSDV
ncbi:MAG: hypothetical protein ACREBR_02215 [bacterium]